MKKHIILFSRLIILFFIVVQFLLIIPSVNLGNINVKAVENDITGIGMEPIISAPMVNLTESITVTYEDINAIDFELEYEADGISTVLLEDEDYLELEISALENVEFGTLNINAIANDGSIYSSTLYTYNNGNKLHLSEFSKDHALYLGLQDMYDSNLATEAECENKYAEFTSQDVIKTDFIDWIVEGTVTTVSGKIKWETSNTPALGETDNPTLPMRNALVQVGVKLDGVFISWGSDYTDAEGNYNIEIDHSGVLDGADLYIRVKLEAYTILLATDWFFDHYFYEAKLIEHDLEAGTTVQAKEHILRYDSNSWLYKATYVHQAMVIGERFALEMGMNTSRIVRVAFPSGRLGEIDKELADQGFCGGNLFNSSYSTIGIDSYNNIQMIVHEYSHYVQKSMDNYDANIIEIALLDPTHDPNIDLYEDKENKSFAMHLTWTEGWGYAFSVMAQKYYEDEYEPLTYNNYHTNISVHNDYTFKGEFQQQSVESFIWSLIDENKANWNIGVLNPTLDYQLPWTPQEWWKMTTIQGTCRLPDFINLIEHESYNLGVDIDYKQIKEYIADKLTTYNIAPEITSISFTDGDVTAPPVLRFIPNGSVSYPNNLIVIKIYDSNYQLLAESEEIYFNAGNLETFPYTIPQSVWDEFMELWECKSSGTTIFKISIEGYRNDNVNEIYAKSGPYYSRFIDLEINIPHNSINIYIDENSHSEKCSDCGYVASSAAHNYGYRGYNSTHHEKYCVDCGYVESRSRHSFRLDGIVGNYNRCLSCGAMIYVGGNDIYPVQSEPPKDPSEETE